MKINPNVNQMRLYSIFTLLLCLSLSLCYANDCSSARTITLGVSTTEALDGIVDYSPPGQRPCSGTTPTGDVWFEWIPPSGSNTVNYDVTFRVIPSTAMRINVALLYSESVDAGDPCSWGTNTEGYSYYTSLCNKQMNGNGHTYFFKTKGLDGSGHFFLLVERVGGTGGSITVIPRFDGTCTPPSNDRCNAATVMSSGNGIDPNLSTGSVASWSESISATTRCATKQRMDDSCQPGGADPTEDHFGNRFLGACHWAGNIGDDPEWPSLAHDQCDEFLENTVWYTFTVPFNQQNWNIYFGSPTTCELAPNNMVAMLLENVSCSDADAAERIRCDKFNVAGNMPSADLVWNNLTLNSGTTYHIVLDGTRGSQCDLNILLTRSTVLNPVLPAQISTFEAENNGRTNQLYWETSLETNHDFFEVEVSTDNSVFTSIGSVVGMGNVAEGQINSYDFTDNKAPVGVAYYRLKMVDQNGGFVYSKTIEVLREVAGLTVDAIYPVPMRDELHILLGSARGGDLQIEMMDISGRIVKRLDAYITPGSNETTFDVSGLPSGMYLFRIQQGGETLVKKVTK